MLLPQGLQLLSRSAAAITATVSAGGRDCTACSCTRRSPVAALRPAAHEGASVHERPVVRGLVCQQDARGRHVSLPAPLLISRHTQALLMGNAGTKVTLKLGMTDS